MLQCIYFQDLRFIFAIK